MSTTYGKNFFNIKINEKIKKLKTNIENRLGSFYSCILLLIAEYVLTDYLTSLKHCTKWPVL